MCSFPLRTRPLVRASVVLAAALTGLALTAPARAGEVFAGAYVHEVETPFTLETDEGGHDVALGYRFDRIEALSAIGKPAPYVVGSLNVGGDTSFVAAGLAWTIGKGPVYLRPGIGIALHDGPKSSFGEDGTRYDLGSRVVFEPEIAIGARLSDRVSVEASWMHLSHARLFNSDQNPGIDMIGARVSLAL